MRLSSQLEQTVRERNLWHEKYNQLMLQYKDKEVRQLYSDYMALKKRNKAEIEQLKQKRLQIRFEFKNGNITNLQYQPLVTPINKRKEHLEMELELYKIQRVRELFPDSDITFGHVVDYVQTTKLLKSEKQSV